MTRNQFSVLGSFRSAHVLRSLTQRRRGGRGAEVLCSPLSALRSCSPPSAHLLRPPLSALHPPLMFSALRSCSPPSALRSPFSAHVLRSCSPLCAHVLRSALMFSALRSCSPLSALRSCSPLSALRSCSPLSHQHRSQKLRTRLRQRGVNPHPTAKFEPRSTA